MDQKMYKEVQQLLAHIKTIEIFIIDYHKTYQSKPCNVYETITSIDSYETNKERSIYENKITKYCWAINVLLVGIIGLACYYDY